MDSEDFPSQGGEKSQFSTKVELEGFPCTPTTCKGTSQSQSRYQTSAAV